MKNVCKICSKLVGVIFLNWIILVAIDLICLKVNLDSDYYYHILSFLIAVIDCFWLKHFIKTNKTLVKILCVLCMVPLNIVFSMLVAPFVPRSWGFEFVEYFYIISNAQVILLVLAMLIKLFTYIKENKRNTI